MKKYFSVLFCFIFLLSTVTVFSAEVAYTITELGIVVSVPDGMYVFTRDVSPADKRIEALGLNFDAMMANFEAENIYLEAMDTDEFNEILVTAEVVSEQDYSELGYDGLYNAIVAEEKALEAQGRTVLNADLHEHGGVDFVMVSSQGDDSRLQCSTVYGGKKIMLKFVDYDGNITENETEVFEKVLNSVEFALSTDAVATSDSESVSDAETIADSDADSSGDALPTSEDLGKISLIPNLIFAGAIIILSTLLAFLFRLFFSKKGFRASTAKIYAVLFSLLIAVLIWYLVNSANNAQISVYICIVPLLWGFVVYKILKRS